MTDTIQTISCDNLDEAVERYTTQLGYRLDMIAPADSPREALVSKGSDTMRLLSSAPPAVAGGLWVKGRAGMEYRDLLPDRLGGRLIASHIRLTKGGEVPDYVHYHKVDFQLIYCKSGRIKVVYEDQGPPFWLETGDCVLQPPEIRHRVLECTAGAEVIEVSMPAEHETWVEHDIALPTAKLNPGREFSGQRFLRHIAACQSSAVRRDLGISEATSGRYTAHIQQMTLDDVTPAMNTKEGEIRLYLRLDDAEALVFEVRPSA